MHTRINYARTHNMPNDQSARMHSCQYIADLGEQHRSKLRKRERVSHLHAATTTRYEHPSRL